MEFHFFYLAWNTQIFGVHGSGSPLDIVDGYDAPIVLYLYVSLYANNILISDVTLCIAINWATFFHWSENNALFSKTRSDLLKNQQGLSLVTSF